jgi:hypothetical protein
MSDGMFTISTAIDRRFSCTHHNEEDQSQWGSSIWHMCIPT